MNLGLHGLDATQSRPAAIIRVSWEALAMVLRLPAGMRVTAMKPTDQGWNDCVAVLRVEGPGLPNVPDGMLLPEVMPVYRRAACGGSVHWQNSGPSP